MKAKAFSAAIAFTGLMALSGTAASATEAEGGYHRAFYGDSGAQVQEEGVSPMGKAAYGEAEGAAFSGPSGGIRVLTHNGLAAWEPNVNQEAPMGKAAFGSADNEAPSVAGDALGNYHRAFFGD